MKWIMNEKMVYSYRRKIDEIYFEWNDELSIFVQTKTNEFYDDTNVCLMEVECDTIYNGLVFMCDSL